MINEVMLKGLLERRSVRSFKPQQITDEELQAVLEAGMYAPTAKGNQSPIIVAVQNPDEVAAVSALNAKFTENPNPYYGAPTILLVLVPRGAYLGNWDGSAVLTNLCNGAHAAGIGSCWIALVPKQEIEGEMGDTFVGLQARLMSQALRKLAGTIAKTNCVVIFINQLRVTT